MSWNARRFQPGKPVLRAVRHRKKTIAQAQELASQHGPVSESEIQTALRFAVDHHLFRWVAILRLAEGYAGIDKQRIQYREAYLEEQQEVSRWKMRWLQERQKVRALEAKIGSLRQARQLSRTRMRAGGRTIRGSSRS